MPISRDGYLHEKYSRVLDVVPGASGLNVERVGNGEDSVWMEKKLFAPPGFFAPAPLDFLPPQAGLYILENILEGGKY